MQANVQPTKLLLQLLHSFSYSVLVRYGCGIRGEVGQEDSVMIGKGCTSWSWLALTIPVSYSNHRNTLLGVLTHIGLWVQSKIAHVDGNPREHSCLAQSAELTGSFFTHVEH